MANEMYYSLLGVSETATAAQIRAAYLRLISEVHPDRVANAPAYWQRQAEEKCKEINEAYAVLSSDEKRRLYDAQLASCRGDRATASGPAAEPSDPPAPSSSQQNQAASPGPPQNDTRTKALFIPILFSLGFVALIAILVFTSAPQGPKEPPIYSWRYTKSTDEMTGEEVSQTACLFSENRLNEDEKMPPGELCSYKGSSAPAVFEIGKDVYIPDLDSKDYEHDSMGLFPEPINRRYCMIRMRVDDKPVFTVCGSRSSRSEVTLFDSPFDDGRGIHIMSVLKAAKIMKIELKVDNGKNQIFTFKPDKPLDRKW